MINALITKGKGTFVGGYILKCQMFFPTNYYINRGGQFLGHPYYSNTIKKTY